MGDEVRVTVIATGFGGGRRRRRGAGAEAPVPTAPVRAAGCSRCRTRPSTCRRSSARTDCDPRFRPPKRGTEIDALKGLTLQSQPHDPVRRPGPSLDDAGAARFGGGSPARQADLGSSSLAQTLLADAAVRPPRRARRDAGPVRRLGDAGAVRGRDRGAPAVRTDAGAFDVSHMGEIEVEGPRAPSSCRACSRTTSTNSRPGRRSTRCSRTSAAGSSTT